MTEPTAATTRWGIMATGRIAHDFAGNLQQVPGAEIAAVGSRSQESADAFAARFGGRAHGSYEALAADPDVDVVYVASPHAFHLEHARLAFDAGKHVLCEKPLTLNAAEAEAMVAAATQAGRFLMEAMWMACNPVIRALRRASRRAASARHGRCTPTSGSWWTSRPPAGCSTPTSAAGRCSTWASIR